MERVGVLFVCLGNICRSPLAEGIFLDLVRKRNLADRFDVDSCGTGAWHIGERADHRSLAVARRHGIELPSIARQLSVPDDLQRFDWLIAMDRANSRSIISAGGSADRVRLIREFDPATRGLPAHELDVPDPYEWHGDGFEQVYQMLDAACRGLLDFLVDELES